MSGLSDVLLEGYQARKEDESMIQQVGMDMSGRSHNEVIESRYLLVDTKPDSDTEWKESYVCNSWREAYEKMACLMFEVSDDSLESNLLDGKSFIKIYSAQTYDASGDRHVLYIIGT